MFSTRRPLIDTLQLQNADHPSHLVPSVGSKLARLKTQHLDPLRNRVGRLITNFGVLAPATATSPDLASRPAHAPAAIASLQSLRQDVQTQIVAAVHVIDETWQLFVIEQIDPLLGKKRHAQIKVLSTSEVAVEISKAERALNRNVGISFAALATGILGATLYPPLTLVSVAAVLWLTIPICKSAYHTLTKKRQVRLDVNGALYMIGVVGSGYFVAGALGELIYYLSEKLILTTYDRSRKSLTTIFGQQPRSVWILQDGVEIEIPFEQLQTGDTLVLDAGHMVPIDGTIVQGVASIDQHMLTGEAQPIEKSVGDLVYASTIVLAGRVHLQVEKTGQETTAAQIGKILKETASYQMSLESKGLQLAHQTALPMLLLSGVAFPTVGAAGAVALLANNFGINIKISSPIAMLNFLNLASHQRILIKDGRSLELLQAVDTVVFDKTGTLTLDRPHVTQIHCCNGYTEELLLTYAAAAERRQPHPIAQAILTAAQERQLPLLAIEHAHYKIGYGICVQIEELVVRVGSDRYMTMEGLALPATLQEQQTICNKQGNSLVMVAINDQLAGAIELQPTIRPEAKQVISQLRQRKLDLYIISGDQAEPTRRLAEALSIEHYFANTLPENKADLVKQLQQAGKSVCFIGDGINDSIALKTANVSVSLRGATTVATDTAQIVLMNQSLDQLDELFVLAEKFNRNMKIGFGAAIIPGAAVLSGVFLLHFGLYTSIVIHSVGLLSSLSIAMLPMLNYSGVAHKKEYIVDFLNTSAIGERKSEKKQTVFSSPTTPVC